MAAVAEVTELYMDNILGAIKLIPQFDHGGQTALSFLQSEFLEQLIAAKHVSIWFKLCVLDQGVIRLHLSKFSTVWIVYEVKTIGSGCLVAKNSVTSIVFEYQVNVNFLSIAHFNKSV